MSSPIDFLLAQLSQLQADLDRYRRMLDGLRNAVVVNEKICDAEAELRLLQDPVWNKVRRLEAAARRSWLSFHRALTDLRKQEQQQARESEATQSQAHQSTAANAQPAAATKVNGVAPGHAPQPHPYPKQ
jgi:hypothetical protein